MNTPRDELLIHRVLNGEAGRADWAELELIAQSDPEVWGRLALSLQAETRLRSALDAELSIADSIEIPHSLVVPTAELPDRHLLGRSPWSRAWLGWAAMFLVAGLWGLTSWFAAPLGPGPGGEGRGTERTGALSRGSGSDRGSASKSERPMDELLERYVRAGQESGRVVGELPRVVMETRSLPGQDALEVLYLRPLVERMRVDEFYRMVSDERGVPSRVRVPYRQMLGGGSL